MLNGLAKVVMGVVLVFLVLLVVGPWRGATGLPGNMVLALDLREPIDDSRRRPHQPSSRPRASHGDGCGAGRWMPPARDARVKGVVMRLGNGALSIAEAEEIDAALHRFRAKGKFVIAQATAFFGAGLGDYLAASAADEIWMQPKSPFSVSGAGGGEDLPARHCSTRSTPSRRSPSAPNIKAPPTCSWKST